MPLQWQQLYIGTEREMGQSYRVRERGDTFEAMDAMTGMVLGQFDTAEAAKKTCEDSVAQAVSEAQRAQEARTAPPAPRTPSPPPTPPRPASAPPKPAHGHPNAKGRR